jgi:hypothetical protein
MRVYYQVYMPLTERSAEVDCYRTLDRKIAWDASGNKRWKPQDIRALCYKTENAVATADCFENIFAQSGNTVDSIYACQSEAAQIARSNAAYRQQVKASEKAMLTQLVSNWRSQQAGEKAASARARTTTRHHSAEKTRLMADAAAREKLFANARDLLATLNEAQMTAPQLAIVDLAHDLEADGLGSLNARPPAQHATADDSGDWNRQVDTRLANETATTVRFRYHYLMSTGPWQAVVPGTAGHFQAMDYDDRGRYLQTVDVEYQAPQAWQPLTQFKKTGHDLSFCVTGGGADPSTWKLIAH